VLKHRIQTLFFAMAVGLLATGCQTYEQQNRVIQYWHQGNLTNAVAEATKMADQNAKNKDAIIWRLEQGAVLRGNGQYEDSNKAFDLAQEKIDDYAQKAKVRVGQEAGALLSNQANLDYEGRAYDGIMLNTYKALNFLALGETDKARPELIRAYQRQQDAVEDNKKRIEAAQAQATNTTTTTTSTTANTTDTTASSSMFKKRSKSAANTDAAANNNTTNTNSAASSAAVEKAQKDPKFQAQIQSVYTNLGNLKPYANYVNPFTVYLDGLYFMANAADASDLERAHKSLERVAGFDPDNNYVKQDLAAVDGVMQGKPLTPTTYVIFETGCAPVRDQIRIDIPIIVARVSYVGAAFPTLKPQGNCLSRLTVTANSPIVTANDTVTTASSTSTTTTTNNTAPATSGTSTATNETATTVGGTSTATNDTVTTVNSTTTTTNNTTVTTGSTTTTTNGTTVTSSSTTTTVGITTATSSSTTATTSLIASMDSVIGLDFKNEMPVVITKTVAATVTKAVAAYMANEAVRQAGGDIAGLFAQIGTAVYQAAVNIADERTWTTLPKEFQVCRFSTPPDRKIVLETPDGTQKIPVTIEDGTINIVYVRSITATSPLLVTQMKLK
jgi:hypothetical protein